jgi:hypothetical protein
MVDKILVDISKNDKYGQVRSVTLRKFSDKKILEDESQLFVEKSILS